MKKLFYPTIISAMTLLFCSTTMAETIFSDSDTMYVLDAYGLPGDTVDVMVKMANPSYSIEGMSHRIVYNQILLEVDTVFCIERGCNLEAFTSDYSVPGVVRVLAVTWISHLIPRGSGPVFVIRFVVKSTAIPGTNTVIDFEDEFLYENQWSDSLGANLIIPQFVQGNFSVIGGGINIPPVIGFIGSQSIAEGQILQFAVVAHDPDADPLTLTASGLPPNATFPAAQGDSLVSSIFTFHPDFNQGPDTIVVTFSVTDDHNNLTELPVQIVIYDQPNDVIGINSNQGGIPGAQSRPVEIVLFNTAPIYGAQYEILYDPAVIDIPEVNSTYRCTNMWFNSNEPEPGRIIIVIFSVGIDSIAAGQGPITELIVDVNDDTLFGPTDIIFQSAIEVIDSVGTSKDLNSEDGYFTVDGFGDANLDGEVDVGDCLSIVAYIIGVHSYSDRQRDAADFNSSGFVDIGDLQDIVNFILEITGLPQGNPGGPPIVVELLRGNLPSNGTIAIPLQMSFSEEVSAVQFEIEYNSAKMACNGLSLGEIAPGMALDYNISENKVRGVIYNLIGETFGPAAGQLAELEFDLIGTDFDPEADIRISDFIAVNPAADYIPVEIKDQLPDRFSLGQNYPNPFNAGTNISFNLPEAGQVKLQVYDLLGRKVNVLLNSFLQAGNHIVSWDGRSEAGGELASGVYFYRLQAEKFDETKKMLLIR